MFWQSKANRCYEFRCARHKYSISYIFYQHQKTNHFPPQTMKVFFLFHTNLMVQFSSFYWIMQFVEQQNDIELSCLMPPKTQLQHKEICAQVCFLKCTELNNSVSSSCLPQSKKCYFNPSLTILFSTYQQITSFSSVKDYLSLTYKMRQ